MTPFLQQCYDSAAAAKVRFLAKKGRLRSLTLAISRSISLSLIVSHLTN